MKRILCILLAILMLTPTAFADEADLMTYRLTGDRGHIGDTVTMTVSVENAPACAAYESTFAYDPAVLQPTGDYKKMAMNGILMVNTDATEDGKKVIKVAAISTLGKLLEGDMDLFNLSFKIIGDCADESGSKIEILKYNFNQNDDKLTAVSTMIIQPCRMVVVAEEQPSQGGENAQPEQKPEQKPEEEPKEEQPESEWYIEGDQAVQYFPAEPESSKQYTVEYEKNDKGETTGVILYDEEEKEAGKLEVETDEYGHLIVTDEDLKEPFSYWFLLPIGAAVLIAIGAVVIVLLAKKSDKGGKKKS